MKAGQNQKVWKLGILRTVYRILKIRKTYGAAPYDKFRGHDGPIKLKRGPATNPLFQSFFDAGVEAAITKTPDVNGFRQEGFGPFDSQVHRGRRMSASRAYLHPAMSVKLNR